MWLLTLVLLIHQSTALTDPFNTGECVIDYRSIENMWEQKLSNDIKNCGYDLFTPPRTNSSAPLKVMLKFLMKAFKFDSQLQEFTASMWTVVSWTDSRLQWDSKKYDGIEVLQTTTGSIWAPGIKLVNVIEEEWDQRYWYIPCEVSSDGGVQCVAWIVYKVKCGTDLKDWPYDAQNCQLEYGPYSETGTKIQLDLGSRAISMIGAEYGAEWDIMDYQQEVDMTSNKQLIMKFRLERHGEVLAALVIYPSVILTALTFFSLFLDARQNLRLLMLCFSLMNHFDFLTNLSWEIPENSNPPRLLLYYRGSFILTSVLFVQSIVLKMICKRSVICPDWITSINDFVFMKLPKFIIWPRWDTKVDKDLSATNFAKDWTDFANIVNYLWIIATVIVYVSLYCVLIPKPIPF